MTAISLTNAQLRKLIKPNKYGAVRTSCGFHSHHSRREAERCQELCLLEKAGAISGLKQQPRFKLTGGIRYVGDFAYTVTRTQAIVIEDTKGVRTQAYKLKRKLMQACYGIEILET